MAENAGDSDQFVLTTPVVRWGIEQLQSRKVHTFFPAYLEIRRTAVEVGSGAGIHPNWGNLEQFLQIPGGPPGKPNFRPFWHGSRKQDQDWLNENIAGSYAPSSIRKVPLNVVKPDGSGYSLLEDHSELALEHLLFGEALPVLPLAVFYYRNFGFQTAGPSLSHHDLVDVFRRDFGFSSELDSEDFEILFTINAPDRDDWFEPWEPSSSAQSEMTTAEA